MSRKTQRAVLNLAIFGSILCLILYLNLSSSKDKTFEWNQIRYKSSSTQLPEARGICSGLADTSKPALVVARVQADGDPGWLDPLAKIYHTCVYTADAPLDVDSNYLQVPANRGHEAMPYLTFLIDNYDQIPMAGAVFIHGSRWAWHNDAPDYDNAALLTALNLSSALELWGYHNLRCDWSASTCLQSASPQGSLKITMQATTEPWNARAVSDNALPRALATLFGGNDGSSAENKAKVLLGRNDAVRAQCCAQFVVSRERVWQHSRAEYFALRQWLLDGGPQEDTGTKNHLRSSSAAPADDRVAGRILSYVWHILFMPRDESTALHSPSSGIHLGRLNALACPRADECYCRLYGRCGLEGCLEHGHCYGQYVVPPGYKLPDDWVATRS